MRAIDVCGTIPSIAGLGVNRRGEFGDAPGDVPLRLCELTSGVWRHCLKVSSQLSTRR